MNYETINLRDSSAIKIPIPQSYKDCLALIESDLYRIYKKRFSLLSIILKVILHPLSISSMMIYFRLCKIRKGILYPFARVMYSFSSFLRQFQLPFYTKVGFGFYIGHGICVVINGGTIIGNNVNISQFLNIGTNKDTPAIIGDNVYIAPMVSIVENVEIGACSIVGAGAVVTKDVPAYCTVAGVPAKKISDKYREKRHYWWTTSTE